MKSVLLVALSNLRHRKKQNLLAGLSILLSVLLLTTAIGILLGINKPFDMMFDRLKASHILLYYDIRQNDSQKIIKWFKQQPEVEFAAEPHHFLLITEPLTYNSEKIDIMVRITEMGAQQEEYDQLLSMGGDEATVPGWEEVWIPRHFSVKYDIAIGDTLRIPLSRGLFPLIVSDIVVDPHYASGLINPNRIWIAPGMLPFMVQTGEMNQVMQGIRLHNREDIDLVWARFNREMNYSGSNLQYSLFKSVFTSIYKIIGMVIILFSVLAIIISSFIISAIITNTVLADSQLTGSLKALGFTTKQVTGIYLLQYLLLSAIAIPAGLAASLFSIRAILQSIMRSIGVLNLDLPLLTIFASCALFFVLLIIILILVCTRKAGKIPPAQALRSVTGDTNISRKKNRSPVGIGRAPMPLWIAFQLLFDNPRKSIISAFSLVLTAFMLGFSVNTANSFSKIAEYKSLWGFDNSDLQVSRSTEVILPLEHEQFVHQMKQEELIREVVPYSYYELTIPGSEDSPPIELTGKVFEDAPAKIGLENITGRHPEREMEIALCVGTAGNLEKSTGDSVLVLMEHEPRWLNITGIYQDISNMGAGFRLSSSAVKAVYPLYEPDKYALILTDRSNTEVFKSDLLKRYGEAIKIELTIEEQLGFLGISKSINASMILISLFFICVLMVSVFNDIFLNIWENRKTIGVYKLIGFTHPQLQRVMIWKTGVVTLAGILVGWPLALFFGPRLMGSITSGFGVVEFPFAVTVLGSITVYILLLVAAGLSSRWASESIKKITPRVLVNE